MTRQIRILKAQSWYYVRNFCRTGAHLFKDQEDVDVFLALLKEVKDKYKLEICAYGLADTKFQLLLYLSQNNLSDVMKHINGIYTQYFNRRHELDSSLFKGRYQACLLQPAEYPLWICHLIHSAKCSHLHQQSSSQAHYSSKIQTAKHSLVSDKKIKALLDKSFSNCTVEEFQAMPLPLQIKKLVARKTLPAFMGGSDFANQLNQEIPSIPPLTPNSVDYRVVLNLVAGYFDLSLSAMCKKRSPHQNARGIAMYLTQRHSQTSLKQLAEIFSIGHFASVSNRISQFRKSLANSNTLARDVSHLNQQIISQSQNLTIGS